MTVTETTASSNDELAATFELFSVDDHIIEPPSVWTDRLPAKYQEAGPHVIEDEAREFWLFEGKRLETMGLNAVAGKENKDFSMDPVRYSDMIEGCYDPRARARDMLADGIVASVCFPTFPRFAGVRFLLADDKELADLCVKAYNDWLIDDWCASVPGLYVPMIIGQLWHPEKMAAEIRRCAERGNRAVTFPESPAAFDLPSFHTDHWDPVWQACVDTDTTVCIHIGTSGLTHQPSADGPFTVAIALGPTNAQITLIDLVLSDVPRRFPAIKFAMSEGGIGWVPFALERMDRTWGRHRYWAGMDDMPPSEVFRRNFWVCFIDERMGIEARHHIGIEKIMWECDYPHADTPWPGSQAAVQESLAGVPAEELAAMTHGNARRLFRWDERPDTDAILGG